MSSKKGKKGKKAKEPEEKAAPDQYDMMDSDQLKMAIVEMTARLKEFKNQRISFQIERDQVQQFLDIAHDEVKLKEAALENIESEMEKKQEMHLNDIRWYMSKVTHLELDHQNSLNLIEQESETTRKNEAERSDGRRAQLRAQHDELVAKINEEGVAHEQAIRSLLGLQQKEIRKLNQEFEKQSNQLANRYQAKLAQLSADLDLQRKMEIHEIEERMNTHINDLMQNHEKSFNEMRDYYNSITRDNLALINSLKDELGELKSKAIINERTIEEIGHENRKLSEPLTQTQNELKDLKAKLASYHKEKHSLKLAKIRAAQLDAQLKRETAQMEVLTSSVNEIQNDRDRLYAQFESIISSVQTKAVDKSSALEKQLDKFIERFTRKSNQFNEVVSAANLDNKVVGELTNKLDAVLDSKNAQIKQLALQIAQATKAHDNLVRIYNAKLPELGIPVKGIDIALLGEPQRPGEQTIEP
ncbi:Growth arrest-specific protein 8 domain-containing protein [Plasmodiophora brassicae]|uniref:Growth arrest-specific protein 8 domain-containing protein n=1 Tax=Plasmodiophora brassicae TaxID=37360 RepID=A0A0G4INM1_PLABS|nr:hypothetical protein PBRA_005396 [Plasmodiophora brassicae]SPR00670.1 unnamed protein product [Plasmodiophora brassicae]